MEGKTGLSFIENALIKARHASLATGLPALADDSGLCVDSLGGEPGIYSARFAGTDASDSDNVSLLLERLIDEDNRRATFVCVLACVSHATDPLPLIAEGHWQGSIARHLRGEGGFGYDPVFIVGNSTRTAAELPASEKNAISHRGLALRKMASLIREQHPA